ncbi:hypothetical protein HID58_080222, partial [Brassica napus]
AIKRETTVMFKDLPLELELEILVRVPATSLTHLKSTCKRWYVLLKERFIEKNMGKGARQFILKKDDGVYSVSIGLDNSFEFTRYENDNKSFQSYKIMRSSEVRNEFGIYDFNSDSWRLLDRLTHIWFIRSRGVSLKGSIYWVAWDRCKPFTRKYLVRFDFKREIFERLSLPFRSNYFDGEFSLSVVREERLSVFLQKFSEMKIWVMDTKIDEAKSTNIQYSLVVDFSDIWSTYMSSM